MAPAVLKATDMLRLSAKSNAEGTVLRLEGEVAGPWVAELRRELAERGERGERPALDMADVTWVDQEGAQLLRTAMGAGSRVCAASQFVAELLTRLVP